MDRPTPSEAKNLVIVGGKKVHLCDSCLKSECDRIGLELEVKTIPVRDTPCDLCAPKPSATVLESKVSELDNQRLLERAAKTVATAHESLLRHILDLDARLGGGMAAPALAAMSALTQAMAEHYVLEMRINLIRHRKQFQCVPMDVWKKAAGNVASEEVARAGEPEAPES